MVAPNLTIAGGASSSTASQEDAGRDRKSLIEGLMKDLGDPEENFYKHSFPGKRSLLPMDAELPVVMSLKDQSSGRAHSVEQLRDADIVVTNYQQLPNKKLEVFPKDFFDAIIVDEAHHCEAQSMPNENELAPDLPVVCLLAGMCVCAAAEVYIGSMTLSDT